ncbi:TetR family transcriptional regulator C-terminal domain-containing protein [Paracoccus aeridis]|uniref:TetR family transcriptional regulator C-terminal domain-containing protein n=1 Tax=Paracoccus aeridis TaxID=1966466 RepID=UPI0010AAFD70|nr:TetR family transcriptional regulator C-terminal domain-containing protein [Paracoccus aeridis]
MPAAEDQPAASPARSARRQQTESAILEAALDVFAMHGFRGTTLDQIAERAGMSKPNLLYYFPSKEDVHARLLGDLLDHWLAPLRGIDPGGEPVEEILRYVRRKLAMSHDYPRESRLFAGEIIAGAPRISGFLTDGLRPLVDETVALIQGWIAQGRLAAVDPVQLLFSIWALTQHHADFAAQIEIVAPGDRAGDAGAFLDQMYRRLLTP